MPRKRSATTKKAIRKQKLKSAGRKDAKKKARAVTRKAVAPKKPRTAAGKAPSAVSGSQAVAPEVPPSPHNE